MDIVPYPGFDVKWLHACRRQASITFRDVKLHTTIDFLISIC